MAINTYPAIASPVKSIQRGSAGGAGTVTITAVDITKSMVNIQGTAASGTVAASGAINATSGNISAGSWSIAAQTYQMQGFGQYNLSNLSQFTFRNTGSYNGITNSRMFFPAMSATNNAVSYNANSTNLTGGTTNLVAAQVTGYLSGSTSLVVSAACRYEVVEFN
jgi:hypothetical protein